MARQLFGDPGGSRGWLAPDTNRYVSTMSGPEDVLAGRYRLIALLGQGGMGSVWRASDEQLGREVAIKELRIPEHLDDQVRDQWIARLDREARAAARLKHPGIITVYDRVLGPDGRPWIVMELVQGGSLGDLVRTHGGIAPQRAAEIGLQVLNALHAAHDAGITHRDVKPANILLEGSRVVVTDFGIAALEGDPTLTVTGALIGTPAYMAPEQVRGLPATPLSDMWSLGATLYSAVEGRPPFGATSPEAALIAVATEQPRPALRAGPLEPVLRGLLSKDPHARMAADEVHRRLAAIALAGSSAPGLPVRQPRAAKRKKMIVALVAGALVVLGIAGYAGYGLLTAESFPQARDKLIVPREIGTDAFDLKAEVPLSKRPVYGLLAQDSRNLTPVGGHYEPHVPFSPTDMNPPGVPWGLDFFGLYGQFKDTDALRDDLLRESANGWILQAGPMDVTPDNSPVKISCEAMLNPEKTVLEYFCGWVDDNTLGSVSMATGPTNAQPDRASLFAAATVTLRVRTAARQPLG
jgi:tRNA A-37 threonylcarbamoyl transferase component Bud32